MMRAFFAVPLLILATPLSAQTTTASTPLVKTTESPPSADHIAAAKPVIDKLWPLGTYRKMLNGELTDMMDSMMASMLDLKISDLHIANNPPEKEESQSLREIIAARDPHYHERFRITMNVMFKELTPVMDKIEPQVRTALTTDYARKYTVAQLRDLDRFLATPTGQIYAQNWVSSFYSPEMMASIEDDMPNIVAAMPNIIEKVEKATAHLPLPSKTEDEMAIDAAVVAADAAAAAALDEEQSNPERKWTQADRKSVAKLDNEIVHLSGQLDTLYTRRELHALDAKARSGQELTDDEIAMRDYLRETMKDKK